MLTIQFGSLVVLLLLIQGQHVSVTSQSTEIEMRQKLFTALKKLTCYYRQAFRSINLDTVFGIRVAEGILEKISEEIRDGVITTDKETLSKTERLGSSLSVIVNKTIPYIKSSANEYYKTIGYVISRPWRNIKPFRDIDFNLYVPVSKRRAIHEIGNPHQECLAALHGSARNGHEACRITDRCWTAMTRPGEAGYTLTHQALFFMLGEMQGCEKAFASRLRNSNTIGGLDTIYGQICATMFGQNRIIGQVKHKTRRNIDLFMEQAVLCGLLGYHEFLSTSWLSRVLSWQHPNGCFGEVPAEMTKSGNARKHKHRSYYTNNCHDYGRSNSRITMRTILTEKLLPEHCEAHVTGVATSLLALYLRWLIVHKDQGLTLSQDSHNDFQRRPPKLRILQLSEGQDFVEPSFQEETAQIVRLIVFLISIFATAYLLVHSKKICREKRCFLHNLALGLGSKMRNNHNNKR